MPEPPDIEVRLIIIGLAAVLVLSWLVLWVAHGSLKSTEIKLRICENYVIDLKHRASELQGQATELQEQLRSVGLRRDKTGKLRSTYTVRDER